MSEAAHRTMTVEAFYRWLLSQREGRYELVDGEPVMMAGANNRHDRIVRNALRHFGNHLDGHRCQPFTADIYIAIPAGNRRQSDMGIDCGTPEDTSMEASEPTLVLEVLSPTTRAIDLNEKLEEYKTVPTLEYIVLVDTDHPFVRVYRRAPDRGWTGDKRVGIDKSLDLPLFNLRLPLSDLYAGLTFRPRPRLFDPAETETTYSPE
jgi:Uma2 family endonuclease